MASSSSFWPQPEMPAMPRISPEFAEQDFLFGSVERVTPAFFRTVSLAEVQFQCVAQTILLHVIVGVDVEPVVILIGADECIKGSINIEVRLQIKVELAV